MPAIRFATTAAIAAISFLAFAVPAFATPGTMAISTSVFAQPDSNTIPVGTLGAGESVDISGCGSNWCQISGGGTAGWVAKSAITFKGLLQPRRIDEGSSQPQRPPRPGNDNGSNEPDFSFDFNFGNDNPGPFPPQQPQRPPRPQQPQQQSGACFYSSTNFRGESFCAGRGDSYDYLPRGWDNAIRSVEIFGRARVDLCRDEDLEGACVTLRDSQSRLPSQLDRRASSLEVY